MLRSKKFRRSETIIVWAIASLLLGTGIVGMLLAIERSHWQLAVVSAGIVVLAVLYSYAARRGRPL